MNLDEQTLASPVQEKSVPQPTEDTSNKCHQLAQQLDFLEELTKSIEINKEEFSDNNHSPKEKNEQREESFQEKKLEIFSQIFAWGSNSHGQICSGSGFINDPIPVTLNSIKKLVSVACGQAHTLMMSNEGFIFSMGDNSKCQLGINPSVKMSKNPEKIESFQTVQQITCGANTSYAIFNNVLYSWGEAKNGALGIQNIQSNSWQPLKVIFADEKNVKLVSAGNTHCAVISTENEMFVWGSNSYGQLALRDKENRTSPETSLDFKQLRVTQVSCGKDFTFVITDSNEMLVSGKLPFTIEQLDIDKKVQTDSVTTFQSVAQFEKSVKIIQIETSKFASVLVQPGNLSEPKELFLWGETPLGLFQEPQSLNQLVSDCQDGSDGSPQVFDVKAVKNGQNFSIFVDQTTGLTYQLGAEDLGDPFSSENQVALSELRDARFNDLSLFACGADFIIGESIQLSRNQIQSPTKTMKNMENQNFLCGLQSISEELNISQQSSATKVIKVNKIEVQNFPSIEPSDTNVNIQTPTHTNNKGSKQETQLMSDQTFREDALFKDDLTSTPVSQATLKVDLHQKTQIKVPAIKIQDSTIKVTSQQKTVKDTDFSDLKKNINSNYNQIQDQKQETQQIQMAAVDSARMSSFKQLKPPISYKRDEVSESGEKIFSARDSRSRGSSNPKITPRNQPTYTARQQILQTSNQSYANYKTAQDDFKQQTYILSDQGPEQDIRHLNYSPGISPIELKSTVKDSIADLKNAMNMIPAYYHNQEDPISFHLESKCHSRQVSEANQVRSSSFFNVEPTSHAYACMLVASDQNYISSHGPVNSIQNQQPYSHYQNRQKSLSPAEIRQISQQKTPLQNRFLPVQQTTMQRIQQLASCKQELVKHQNIINYIPAGPNSTGQKQNVIRQSQAIAPTNLSTVFHTMENNSNAGILNMSHLAQNYGGPFAQNLDQSIHYLELEGLLAKEKYEMVEQTLKEEKTKFQNQEQQHRLELDQARAQIQELMKQLEKSGKNYSKLLSQIDKDEDETAQLKEQVRSHSSLIAQLTVQHKNTEDQRLKLLNQKEKLDQELKETVQALKQAEDLNKRTSQNNQVIVLQKQCQNEFCEKRIFELEQNLQKKSQQVYELNRNLGGLELENKELKAEQRERTEAFETRFNDFKDVARQESLQEQEKNEQLQNQISQLKAENEKIQKKLAEAKQFGDESALQLREIEIKVNSKVNQIVKNKQEFFETVNSARLLNKVEEPKVIRPNQAVSVQQVKSYQNEAATSKHNVQISYVSDMSPLETNKQNMQKQLHKEDSMLIEFQEIERRSQMNSHNRNESRISQSTFGQFTSVNAQFLDDQGVGDSLGCVLNPIKFEKPHLYQNDNQVMKRDQKISPRPGTETNALNKTLTPGHSPQKINDNVCFQSNTSTARRLRQQRMSDAYLGKSASSKTFVNVDIQRLSGRIGAKSAREVKKKIEIIANEATDTQRSSFSKILTPMRQPQINVYGSNQDNCERNAGEQDRSNSRLRQPTQITKSPALKAILEKIDKQVPQKQQSTLRNQSARVSMELGEKTLNKNHSSAACAVNQDSSQDAIKSKMGAHKSCPQTNLHPCMESQARNKTPSHLFTVQRTSVGQAKSGVTPRVKKPTATPEKTQESYTPRPGIIGPPMNLASRFEQKSSRANQNQVTGITADNAQLYFNHSASTPNLAAKSFVCEQKRNSLLAKYTCQHGKLQGTSHDSNKQLHERTESEHMINLQLEVNLSNPLNEISQNISAQNLENDIQNLSMKLNQQKQRKLQHNISYEKIQTPVPKVVLHDSTNGLSTMKEKLKSIQDNKQMLEKKIQEYERKLQLIQKKGKKNGLRESYEENSMMNSSQFTSNNSQGRQATNECTDLSKPQGKRPSHTNNQNVYPYRQCMQNVPKTQFLQLVQSIDTSSKSPIVAASFGFNSNTDSRSSVVHQSHANFGKNKN